MVSVLNLEWLTLVRHAESTGNLSHQAAIDDGLDEVDIPERDADIPLSPAGRTQAEMLGRRLAALPADQRPTAVISSPYLRALETARLALDGLHEPPPIEVDERLRDRDSGAFERLTPSGIRARHPEEAARMRRIGKFYYRPPGGESWTDVALRLRGFYHDVALDHPGGRVLVMAHDAVIVVTRYIVERLSEYEAMEVEKAPVVNTSVSSWHRRDGALRPVVYNDAAHLAGRFGAEPG